MPALCSHLELPVTRTRPAIDSFKMIAAQPRGVVQRFGAHHRVQHARQSQRCNAVDGMYNHIVPNFDYINQVLEAFPEDAVANPDEARV